MPACGVWQWAGACRHASTWRAWATRRRCRRRMSGCARRWTCCARSWRSRCVPPACRAVYGHFGQRLHTAQSCWAACKDPACCSPWAASSNPAIGNGSMVHTYGMFAAMGCCAAGRSAPHHARSRWLHHLPAPRHAHPQGPWLPVPQQQHQQRLAAHTHGGAGPSLRERCHRHARARRGGRLRLPACACACAWQQQPWCACGVQRAGRHGAHGGAAGAAGGPAARARVPAGVSGAWGRRMRWHGTAWAVQGTGLLVHACTWL